MRVYTCICVCMRACARMCVCACACVYAFISVHSLPLVNNKRVRARRLHVSSLPMPRLSSATDDGGWVRPSSVRPSVRAAPAPPPTTEPCRAAETRDPSTVNSAETSTITTAFPISLWNGNLNAGPSSRLMFY